MVISHSYVNLLIYQRVTEGFRWEIIGTQWDFQLIRSVLRHLRSHVTQTWWQLRALSPEWRQLLDVRGPGWPRVGARPLVKSTGSDHRKPQRNDFAVIFTEVDILYIFLYNMFGPGKWKMADLNRSVLNRCFMAAVD
jgi:hypothetical protein